MVWVMEPTEKLQKQKPRAARLAGSAKVLSRCYEVHKYLNGRWELASVFDEREDAIQDAKSIFDSSKYSMGVRVLHVVARENQDHEVTFAEQTIFRQSSVDEHNVEASARLLRAWQEVRAARENRRRERMAQAASPRNGIRFDRLAIILGLTVVAWLVVIAMVAKYSVWF
jgi:hypothetical protein